MFASLLVISDKNPLLGVIIYDSCRDDPKVSFETVQLFP